MWQQQICIAVMLVSPLVFAAAWFIQSCTEYAGKTVRQEPAEVPVSPEIEQPDESWWREIFDC